MLHMDLEPARRSLGQERARQLDARKQPRELAELPDEVRLDPDERAALELFLRRRGTLGPAREQELLFARFFRATNARAQGTPGSGLGLSVAKAIVELTGTTDDIARATLALYLDPDRGVMPRQAEIDLKGLAQVIAFMGEGGTIKPPLPTPERFVDLRYLEAAGVK